MDIYKCPKCGNHCLAQFEDVGVGMAQVTPYHCSTCGWTEPCPHQDTCTERCVSYSYCSNRKESKIEEFKDNLANSIFGNRREIGKCVCCGSTEVGRDDFKDELSWKEYSISMFCQKCQESTFV